MAKLSSAAWIAHDIGLAAAIGGTLFGRVALQPALREVGSDRVRGEVADTAWKRFSWINLAAHAVVASTWFVGRSMLSGREVSRTSRQLTCAKDALVVASVVTSVATAIGGRKLGTMERTVGVGDRKTERLRKLVSLLGATNLVADMAIAGVTTTLAMEASHSLPFSYVSRRLP
jgi:uncharacterized membrane protein